MITESTRNCCDKFKTMGFGLNKMGILVLVTLYCCLPSVMPNKDNAFEMKIPASEPLTLLWGIADTTAYVGKLFTYTIPSDAFQGNIVHYNITEAGKDTLPSWLTFNALKTELKGIPGPEDLKKGQIYLEVKVTGDDSSHVEDVFAIDILDNTNGPIGSVTTTGEDSPKVIRCKREEPQTIVTVVVDTDLGHLNPDEKINLLDNMASHLNLAKEMLKLMPVGNKPMFDSSALVVGPGNAKVPKTAGALVSWIVGCGQVDNGHMSTLQQMESAAANGDMTAAMGHDIIGWHVTNTRFQVKPRRRRQATATQSLSPPVPTTIEATSTEQIAATSVSIAPTKTIEVKPTAMPETSTKPAATSTSAIIQPSEATKTTSSSSVATEILPTKTYTMTSSETTTTTKVTPSTTTTTTRSTVETEAPTTKPSTKPTTPSTTTERKTMKPTPEEPCPLGGVRKPPVVNKRLEDQKLTAGSIIRMKIPKDTFTDCYDDSTNELDLKITFSNDEKLPDGFWLQLNNRISRPDILIMNPLNADAGSYTFKLTASNFYEKTASHNFVVVVEGQEMMTSPPNHELSMTIDTDYNKFMRSLDNRIELSNKVSRIFGDKNSNSLAVTRLEKGSVVYAWTNNSMASNDCPTEDLKALFDKMFNKDGTLTENALDSLQPYKINAAAAQPLGSCTNNPDFPKRMMGVKVTTTPKPTRKATTEKKTTSSEEATTKNTNMPKSKPTVKPSTEKTTEAVAAAGAGSGGSDIWITTVVPAIVVVIVLIIALIIACCLYRKRRKGKMKLEEKNKFANSKGVPVIFADEYDEKPNDSTHPLILQDEKPPMPPPEYQRASSETSGNSNSTQPIEDKDIEEIEMEDTSERAPLYSPPPPVTASNNSKPPHVQSSRGPPPYVPP
ncbi:dystroglycan 1-like [Mercenaria mercenaria]|uniref:dystroglycan 1-like n=1 Tax=Mercenaria mercenaria TaxID=6596 RepID=UPI00234F21E3|nr:dystroglycan 1-like [Mercenaria mercenaria]XP_045164540.2 dystroglycan 1-like [Mercenaria mercenaria]XP_045164541.2 dystroglycan 1-like [Mercenaria mercenaria]XP_045164542.2 dystroglycan 1-like [Mercenaria mercenaria]XP_045164543.2 dystroglycan 1-like [Mercenaria mercenaria]XP_045164545.2 dystroglycan 1-like [Mercenaria mercenaria]XP_045164546.2 dystroglycan 1-like [Mercenaria mercenaria]XP_045164547.2 dystroglycan 1-like [Mercenaria mercenaria]XP_045164549.2 dystroglycan 1-like [Mercena